MTEIGKLGEKLVAHWLEGQGWVILYQRWHCRWGEIDLIARAQSSGELVFVEVKTRSRGNWDAGGLLAITPQKQDKLCHSAALFLSEHPDLAEFPCRFDVALVLCRRSQVLSHKSSVEEFPLTELRLGQPILWQGYQLTLENYLPSAFDAEASIALT